jgi:hypothetical protein
MDAPVLIVSSCQRTSATITAPISTKYEIQNNLAFMLMSASDDAKFINYGRRCADYDRVHDVSPGYQ